MTAGAALAIGAVYAGMSDLEQFHNGRQDVSCKQRLSAELAITAVGIGLVCLGFRDLENSFGTVCTITGDREVAMVDGYLELDDIGEV